MVKLAGSRGRGGGRGRGGRGGSAAPARGGRGVAKKSPKAAAKLSAAKGNAARSKAPAKSGGANARRTLLLQHLGTGGRTWSEFASVAAALDSFIAGYEKELKRLNPDKPTLSYTADDLHVYVDSLKDVSMLVMDPQTNQCANDSFQQSVSDAAGFGECRPHAPSRLPHAARYASKGKPFVKGQLLSRLKEAAK